MLIKEAWIRDFLCFTEGIAGTAPAQYYGHDLNYTVVLLFSFLAPV